MKFQLSSAKRRWSGRQRRIKCFPGPDELDVFEPLGDQNGMLLALKLSGQWLVSLVEPLRKWADAYALTRSPVQLDDASFVILCGSITYFLADPLWKTL